MPTIPLNFVASPANEPHPPAGRSGSAHFLIRSTPLRLLPPRRAPQSSPHPCERQFEGRRGILAVAAATTVPTIAPGNLFRTEYDVLPPLPCAQSSARFACEFRY